MRTQERYSLQQYEELDGDQHRWTELDHGRLVERMDPLLSHQEARTRLLVQLDSQLPTGLVVLPGCNLLLSQELPTVRIPDVVVLPRAAVIPGKLYAAPGEVLLVVEVLSPSNAVTDLVDKRLQYAKAGIPLYLVVDIVSDDQRLILLALAESGHEYRQMADGEIVQVQIGEATARLTLAQ